VLVQWPGTGRFASPLARLLSIESFLLLCDRVSLSDVDRQLLDRCLSGSPRAWEDFVDRFLGLVIHVANHTAQVRGVPLQLATRDDLVADVFMVIIAGDYAPLRRFQRNCSLATYLTVIARRVIVRKLASGPRGAEMENVHTIASDSDEMEMTRLENFEEVQDLLLRLEPQEAQIVRMYHLEGMSYHQISQEIGMSENSIGPALSRARSKMRGTAGA
jgi:RNA polymerase sigma-70 factor, ECF subfamily